ncbi:alpha/beta hydrolase [Planctomicrobium sp. SH661]|uniref:alpha/beta hydrolase n=1 Tax=Planctomicrobium sp. SH661 TaxID=3448124 RepID=UPI003F5C9719
MANLEVRRIAELDCHLITSESTPLLNVILCHGFGAPGDDLVPIGAQLLQEFPDLLDKVQFIFPSGPISLDPLGIPGGRAWWPLDMDRLTRTVQERDFHAFRKHVPPELPAARDKLLALVNEVCEETGLETNRVVLGGFSQGAMISTDVALRLPTPPAGLIVWSGSLLSEEDWNARNHQLKDVPVIQSHGREDPILPYEAAIWLRDLFLTGAAKLDFFGFRGPHTIPREAVNATGQLLERLLGIIE